MTDQLGRLLGPGDRAPDFDLPAADRDGRLSLSDFRRRGPVLLLLLRGLYCPFCRRHISQLKSSCDILQGAGIPMLGVVIASPERSRMYFRFGNSPCFPLAAAPDRSLHRAYGLTAVVRTPEMIAAAMQRATEILREMNIDSGSDVADAFQKLDGFELTPDDDAEYQRPLQAVGYYFVDRDGVIRWSSVGKLLSALPEPETLLALV
jgi:peroxiredoxin